MIATRIVLLMAAPCLLAHAGCTSRDAVARGGDSTLATPPRPIDTVSVGPPDTLVVAAIGERLDRATRPEPLSAHQWRHVRELYDARGRVPLWLDGTRLR